MIWLIETYILQNQRVDSATFSPLMGLLLLYTLNIINLLINTLLLGSQAENSFNSMESVGTYVDYPSTCPLIIENNRLLLEWHSSGIIEFKNVVMSYCRDLLFFLCGISFRIMSTEKVGVVRCIGTRKSCMFNCLFQIAQLKSGKNVIDECDVSSLG